MNFKGYEKFNNINLFLSPFNFFICKNVGIWRFVCKAQSFVIAWLSILFTKLIFLTFTVKTTGICKVPMKDSNNWQFQDKMLNLNKWQSKNIVSKSGFNQYSTPRGDFLENILEVVHKWRHSYLVICVPHIVTILFFKAYKMLSHNYWPSSLNINLAPLSWLTQLQVDSDHPKRRI